MANLKLYDVQGVVPGRDSSTPWKAPPRCVACDAPDPTDSLEISTWAEGLPGAGITSRVSVTWGCPACKTAVRLGETLDIVKSSAAVLSALAVGCLLRQHVGALGAALIIFALSAVIWVVLSRSYVAPVTVSTGRGLLIRRLTFDFRHAAYAAPCRELNGLNPPATTRPT